MCRSGKNRLTGRASRGHSSRRRIETFVPERPMTIELILPVGIPAEEGLKPGRSFRPGMPIKLLPVGIPAEEGLKLQGYLEITKTVDASRGHSSRRRIETRDGRRHLHCGVLGLPVGIPAEEGLKRGPVLIEQAKDAVFPWAFQPKKD